MTGKPSREDGGIRNHGRSLGIDIYNSDSDGDRDIDRFRYRQRDENKALHREEGHDSLSPLSPSFGPRRGDNISGTVERSAQCQSTITCSRTNMTSGL